MAPDLHRYTEEHLLAQMENAPYSRGFFTLRFYADERNKPSREPTGRIEEFYLYPSGGTLRDKDYNLIWYAARFDTYHGFVPPGKNWKASEEGS
jgi:hypothetical protein